MKISLVIPTKNRQHDLHKAILSVVCQTRLPDELIIVDQSKDLSSKKDIENIFFGVDIKINLIYIFDNNISGLVEAKKIGFNNSSGDIICFIDDDVILEPDYFAEVERHFLINPSMLGCCGVTSNTPHSSNIYLIVYNLFHRGIIKNNGIHIKRQINSHLPKDFTYESNVLSGGISSWKRIVLKNVTLDCDNNFHFLEDIDYSTRASYEFGNFFYIIPSIKLQHNMSPINRESLTNSISKKVVEYIIFFKKRKHRFDFKIIHLYFLLFGVFINSFYATFKFRSFGPIKAFNLGLVIGFKKKVFLN